MNELNETQRQAVTAPDGPTLVLAGAGSGKTRVIVERLAWLVQERGVDPRHLLALTFTNKAAGEMRHRVAARLSTPDFSAWVGTFHSFGLFLLRRYIDRLGRPAAFTVFDDDDQLALMKRLIKDLPATFAPVSPRDALQWISGYKHRLGAPVPEEADESLESETYHTLWSRYHAALFSASAVDFDDLLVLPARLLQDHADVRERLQTRYRYVHIDEYQDTNHAQYVIAQKLSEAHGNIFVVGDEDQSIYGWRGAEITNILNFERDFPRATVIRLEQNYRSAQPILDAANAVVSQNKARLGKNLWTEIREGAPVRVFEASDADAEARFIVDDIVEREISPQDTAVLYRTNSQARVIEEALRRAGMAYVVVGGVRFYARKEIKDVLAYLRLLINPHDVVSLRRIINVPTRGIGATTLEQLEALAQLREVALIEVLRDSEHDETLPGRARAAVTDFVHLIDDLAIASASLPVAKLAERVIEQTGYREFLRRSDEKEFRTRLEIVDEFISACAQFDEEKEGDLEGYLQELALVSDVDSYDASTPVLTMMTCHTAKGLEFDHVYLTGLEEGLLPHGMSSGSDERIEEERRLCYVAMTRARKSLTLAWARQRRFYGDSRLAEPSRFLSELPPGVVTIGEVIPPARPASRRVDHGTRPVAPAPQSQELKMGTRVWHEKFGKGTVMFTKGSGAKLRARIRFETGRTREFMVSAAPLRVLEGSRE